MLTAINASSSASGGTFVCSILSQTMGLATAITRIQVDTVVDTQRRRRDKLGADAVHQADVTP